MQSTFGPASSPSPTPIAVPGSSQLPSALTAGTTSSSPTSSQAAPVPIPTPTQSPGYTANPNAILLASPASAMPPHTGQFSASAQRRCTVLITSTSRVATVATLFSDHHSQLHDRSYHSPAESCANCECATPASTPATHSVGPDNDADSCTGVCDHQFDSCGECCCFIRPTRWWFHADSFANAGCAVERHRQLPADDCTDRRESPGPVPISDNFVQPRRRHGAE